MARAMTRRRRGKRVQLLHCIAPLLTLGRGKTLQVLVASQGAVALLGIHVVEVVQPVEHTLLCFSKANPKTGFVLHGAALVGRGEVLMVLHPLLEVALELKRPRARHLGQPRGG